MKEIAKLVIGSCVVYVFMAACSAASPSPGAMTAAGDDDASPMTAEHDSGSAMQGMMDALTNPVPNANADPMSGSRLKVQYFVSSDGAKVPTGTMFDSMLNVQCGFGLASDGQTRCLPAMAQAIYFVDGNCSQPVGMQYNACTAPKYAAITTPTSSACVTSSSRYFAIGAPFSGSLYAGTPGSCSTLQTSTVQAEGYSLYNLGAEVPASTFAAAVVQTDQ